MRLIAEGLRFMAIDLNASTLQNEVIIASGGARKHAWRKNIQLLRNKTSERAELWPSCRTSKALIGAAMALFFNPFRL